MAEQSPLYELTSQAGAHYVDDAGWDMPLHYGNALAEYQHTLQAASLFDLSHRAKIEVTGAEAGMFLHNLSTNDIKEMPIGAGCEAFFATATARAVDYGLIYHALLHDGRDAFLLDLQPGHGEKMLRYLDRYLISEQAEFADRTREYAHIHLAGPQAKAILEKALLDDVPELDELQHMVRTFGTASHSNIRRHDPLELPGYDIICLNSLAGNVWGLLLRAGAKPAGLQAYDWLRVEAGTPAYGIDIDENRFIVEVGRVEQTISYNKGCYLGQEPVVMARDRGQVQRTFLGLKLTGTEAVPSGSKIFRDGKEVGVTTSSIVSPSLQGPIALAYIKRGNQEPGTAVEVEVNCQRIGATVQALPFPGVR